MTTWQAANLSLMRLIGRAKQADRLHAMIDTVREAGAALVLRGEAGVGKSALIADASAYARAAGLRVLSTVGVQGEARLPYAGLRQLLQPVRDHLAALPPGQREALLSALGVTDATVPDRFLVGMALLNLLEDLAEAAEAAPVLAVVEDAHWLDASTVDALAFVARRLESEPVVFLAAVRVGIPSRWDDSGLPEMVVPPLSGEDSATLLDDTAADLSAALRLRLLAEAAGNPLALTELPVAVRGADATALASPWLPLTARLERAFAVRLAALPPAVQATLQLAALNDSPSLAEALRALPLLHDPTVIADDTAASSDLAPAVTDRLIMLDGDQLTFRHPLVRSAIQQGTGADGRRALHRALASALSGSPGGGAAQPERRTWHLAAATDEPDEKLAAELDAVAANAQRRGNAAVAVAALEEAARLSPDAGNRADRLLRAADSGVELGRQDIVDRLLGQAAALSLTGQQRARATWIRSAFDDGVRDLATGAKGLADLAAEVAADGDTDLALRILWSAALRCTHAEPGAAARDQIVAMAESLPVDEADARLLAILACAAPIDRGAVVIERSRRLTAKPLPDPQAAYLVSIAAVVVGTFDVAITQAAAAVPALKAQGRMQLAARALTMQSWAATQVVDLAVAIPATMEGARLAKESGQPYILAVILACQGKLAAVRGQITEALALAGEAEAIGTRVGARHVLATAQHARALAALAAGDHDQALARLLRLHDPADPCCQLALRYHAVADLADAASRCERPGDVADVIAEMEDFALRTPSPSLHDGLRLARAVLAADKAAEGLFQAALSADLSRRPFVRARTELAYGEWLRRQRRAADSRHPLRSARDTFDALGATPWGERARRELRAAGERSAERKAVTSDLLTGQELQIAQLAASGLTNREIGKALFISHRTVGAHLARIFPKLGVTSRVQLSSLLSDTAAL